jgi:hypothetical protein
MLDEHHLRLLGKLVIRNLDRIADVDNIRNQRSYKPSQLLPPTMVSENRCGRRHLGLVLGPVKSLVFNEIREIVAVRTIVTLDQCSFRVDHFMCIKLHVIVLECRHVCRRFLRNGGFIDQIQHWNQRFVEEEAM